LLSSNINFACQLNQQIINNSLLINENQKLIKEKVDLNGNLTNQIEINTILNLKIKQLENELNEANEKLNKTCISSRPNDDEKEKIEELNNKINEEINKNKLLNDEIINLQSQIENKNISLQKCLSEKEKLQ